MPRANVALVAKPARKTGQGAILTTFCDPDAGLSRRFVQAFRRIAYLPGT